MSCRFSFSTLAVALLASPALAQDLNDLQEKATKAAVAKVAPSVVQIETSGGTELISTGAQGQQVRKGVGPTTGLVVATDGFIISSAFNFANKPTAIFVTVPGHKERYVAKVIATDRTRMLTLLKIDATALTVPTATPKKDMRVGQWALALGRALDRPEDRGLNQPPSVSVGIISALNRIWGKAAQTDAKVSPANYGGPLVDISGRVQGVLVPASPRAAGETAGLEWYDSGIGFAIPLEDINSVLPRLREGHDLNAGVLGIQMQGGDMSPPAIAAVAPTSAAAKAGIKVGDLITAIDNHPVQNQSQLRHQLGNKYEGDSVTVELKRGKETVKLENIKLTGSLAAVGTPFLGILPMRDDPGEGEEVRYVFPDGPAVKAGLKPGDRIKKIGVGNQMRAFKGRDELTSLLAQLPAGTDVKLEVVRKEGGKTETLTATLGTCPDTIPDKLPRKASLGKATPPPNPAPAPKDDKKKDDKKKIETGFLKRSNAARDHEYWVYVPENYDPNYSYGLMLWLHPVGKGKEKDIEAMKDIWENFCLDHNMIFLAPRAEGENGWVGSEADFVQQAMREIIGQYTIDKQRVVAHGMGIGGQMAFYLGFNARDLVRGVATTGALLASQVKNKVVTQPLTFFLAVGGKDPLLKDIQDSLKKLAEKKHAVIYREMPNKGHQYLDQKTLDDLENWIDSLDRQ